MKARSRSDYTHVESKIKATAERDRALYHQQQKQLEEQKRYQIYEYSDENEMEEESSIKGAENYAQNTGQRSSSEKKYYDQYTYNQQYQSSFRDSHQVSSQKSRRST